MDYKGQMWAEYFYYFLTIFFGAVAWIVGFIKGDFNYTVWGWSVGLGLSLLLCIYDWPIYNRNPVKWLEEVGKPEIVEAAVSNKEKDKKKKQ